MNFYIVEDHPMVVYGLSTVIESHFPGALIDVESNLDTAMSGLDYKNYDFAIIDLNISGKKTFDYIKRATETNKSSKHMVFTSSIRKDYFDQVFEYDVDGYLIKECAVEDLVYAINSILKGRRFVDPIFSDIQRNTSFKSEILTQREKEVLKLMGGGLSNQDIANTLYISVNTVKKYVTSLMSKMEFSNRTEAALFCQTNYV